MLTRVLTSWLLCVLIGAGALAPRALANPCCAPAEPDVTLVESDHHACCADEQECVPAEQEPDDQPCPGSAVCPKACCATPAPIFASGVPALMVFGAPAAVRGAFVPQTTELRAHALSLLRPPRL